MADVLTRSQRSYCMAHVRDRNTAPEVRLRKLLWRAGLRYKLKSILPGKPDLVFAGKKVAIFVDGCFWHRCPQHATFPKTNSGFWRAKLDGNVARDRLVNRELRKLGWSVIRVWTHEIEHNPAKAAAKIGFQIRGRRVRSVRARSR